MATRTKKPMSNYARFVKEEYSKAYVQRLTSPQERIKAIAKRWRSCPAKKHKPGTKADMAATAKARSKTRTTRKRTKRKTPVQRGSAGVVDLTPGADEYSIAPLKKKKLKRAK